MYVALSYNLWKVISFDASSSSNPVTLLVTVSLLSMTLIFINLNGEVSANFEIVKSNNPQTADIIQVWYMLIIVSVIGMGYSLVSLRKEN